MRTSPEAAVSEQTPAMTSPSAGRTAQMSGTGRLILSGVVLLLLCSPTSGAGASPASAAVAARSVAYDGRSLLLDGARVLLTSGSIHYQRLHPSDWPRALALAAEAGFSAVQSYVFFDQLWPLERAAPNFSGSNNVSAFAAAAARAGLLLVLRIGPYICGEHYNGGIPLWLRANEGSGAACFRCADAAWQNFTVRALDAVVGELQASRALYPAGGNIIALQVENEYSPGDQAYLNFCVAAARRATTAVPWLLCHDLDACAAVNAALNVSGGAAVCTINGFWEDASAEGVQQPSPAFVAGQRALNPLQPLWWTEDQAWFDQWGVGQRVRRTSDILYGFARAVALGFTLHNFYMLAGGSNFGLSAAQGVTTAYAPDAAIDSLLLRHEPKFSTVKAFNAALASVAGELLAHAPPAAPSRVGAHCEAAAYGAVTFVSNVGLAAGASELVRVAGLELFMPNHTVVIVRDGAVVFNTSAAPDAAPARAQPPPPPPPRSAPASWTTLVEHIGAGNSSALPPPGAPPLELLALTRNEVDYAYYVLRAPPLPANASTLSVTTCGGEYVYVFVDSAEALLRAAAVSAAPAGGDEHAFALPRRGAGAAGAPPEAIYILVSAMGLSTSPSPFSCKGVRRVSADRANLTLDGWETRWIFPGEAARIYTPAGAAAAQWLPVAPAGGRVPTSWFRALLDLPAAPPQLAHANAASDAVAPPPQLAYALDLDGATKGVAYVNGFNIGRYNLELGVCDGPCAPPIHGGQCYIFWRNCGLPTQRFYHIPEAILLPKDNLVVLFEETATVPVAGQGPLAPSPPPAAGKQARHRAEAPAGAPRDLSRVAIVALTEHP